ncbi:MAG: DUF5995 family protein [Salibacteraceae bacterium]|mgnify:CR=1 FL=1
MEPIRTIDQVIAELDAIIQENINQNNPLGYFAALYRAVTIKVKAGIAEGYFDEGPRMERLDVIFALRYIDAYRHFQHAETITASWSIAFESAAVHHLIVLQHLLLGMNGHINLDLGIAAVEVMQGQDLTALKNDFDKINTILAELVGKVQKDLAEIWPTLGWILRYTGRVDDFLINFSMELARDGAWKFAQALADTPAGAQPAFIATRDQKVARNANIVLHPGFVASTIFRIIRRFERGTVATRIEALLH